MTTYYDIETDYTWDHEKRLRYIPKTKYMDHIRALCEEHDIKIIFRKTDNAANMLSKLIWINPEIRTVKTYFGALHEIGHIVNEHPMIYYNMNRVLWNLSRSKSCVFVSKYRMKTEIDAWKYAHKTAKWTSHAADKQTVLCLLSYVHGYNKSHKQPFKQLDTKFVSATMTSYKNDEPRIIALKRTLFSSGD